tara:strand:- start:382 stop:882 length:501 start_codon:yes stop_codon:yes gene_type:complete
MIHIKVKGSFMPLKKDGATEKDKKVFKRRDPINLLRKALANKLRSKHWRAAHAAKANWMEAAKENAEVSGDAVEGDAIVIVVHALPGKCDIDAPIKVLLDAFQDVLFRGGDDKSVESLVIRKLEPTRKGIEPQVHLFALSKDTEYEEAIKMSSEAFTASDPCLGTG